ncbi:MAG: hypothetical protein ACOC53_05040 [Candidatus Saliniplasma sp.]
MKTIMYSDLIRRDVEMPDISERAKIVDISAKIEEKYWVSYGVIIETGFLGSKARYYPGTLLERISEEGPVKLKSSKKKYERKEDLLLSKIKGAKILTEDEKEIGRVYDFEIFIDGDPWIVWKILVNPVGMSILKRRIRIGTKYVREYKDGKLFLKSGWSRGDQP